MKRFIRRMFTALWIASFVLLGVYYLAFAETDSVYSESEKRMLAGRPQLSAETLKEGTLSEDTEQFLTDQAFLREKLIGVSNSIRDFLSFASYEDYLSVQTEGKDALDDRTTVDQDIDDLLNDMLDEPEEPDETEPESSDEPIQEPEGPEPEETENPEEPEDLIPDEPAVEEPIPVVVPKPDANAEDYPSAMGVYMEVDGNTTALSLYGRDSVLAATSVLNKYAELLPEDGRLIFTMVPQSFRGNQFFNSSRNGTFYSDFEECINAFGADNVFAISSADILGEAMVRGEYVYFRTDMHWAPLGTWLVYSDMVRQAGKLPLAYEDYEITVEEPFLGTYYRDAPTDYMRANYDRLDLLTPPFELEWRRIISGDEYQLIDFLNFGAASNDRYTVYLGGPAGPWTYTDRSDDAESENCLVVTDSFGLAFVPMVAANYDQVHYYDPRYFSSYAVGGSVADMIGKYDITDIYVVVGDLHSFDSGFLITSMNTQLWSK